MNLNRSLNEIETIALRAARGAGMSWGLAQEAGKSTRWLTACEMPASELLSKILQQNDHIPVADVSPVSVHGIWSNPKGFLCPIITGATLSDRALTLKHDKAIEMQNVSFPLFVVPFSNRASKFIEQPVITEWNGVRVITNGQSMAISGDRESLFINRTESLHCYPVNQSVPDRSMVTRGSVDEQCWLNLSVFAHRTYAPATAESRLLGAGSDLSDND